VRPSTTVRFSHLKYGHPLAIDSYTLAQWTGIVADGCAHDLDFHECLLVSGGQAEISAEGRPVRVRGPAIVITPPNTTRVIRVEDPLRLHLVVFTRDALTPSGATAASLLSRIAVLNDTRALRSLNAIAALMAADVAAPRPDSGAMLEALLAPFVIALSRAQARPDPSAPHLVSRFEQLLERRFHQEHAVSAYASALGVSADHLSATLRTHCGVSAKSAIERRLFDEAVRLLISTPLSVAAIAYRLGYAEPGHFTRAFRRAGGVSPRRYRETL